MKKAAIFGTKLQFFPIDLEYWIAEFKCAASH